MNVQEELTKISNYLVNAGVTRDEALTEFDRLYVVAGLRKTNGNACKAAKVLGIHRNSIIRILPDRNRRKAIINHFRKGAKENGSKILSRSENE